MTFLALYDAMVVAINNCHRTDEVKELRDKALALEHYSRQAQNIEAERKAAGVRIRAERRAGELLRETERGKPGPKELSSSVKDNSEYAEAKEQAKISDTQAHRWQKLADVPQEKFEAALANLEIIPSTQSLIDGGSTFNHRAQGTGNNEWYTPPQYITAARKVLGEIDLDPATSERAQLNIQAAKFHTNIDNGLGREWHGRVWLNPPYSQPLIWEFVEKLVGELSIGRTTAAILLTHSYTDTAWFHLAESVAARICFTRGRVKFTDDNGQECAPTQGQAFFYYGENAQRFEEIFSQFGFVR